MKGFSGDSKPRSLSTAYSPSSPESLELPEMKHPILLGPHPEISFADNLGILPSTAFAIPGTATKSETMARRHWDADWLPTFVFNTLNRVTVVFAP
jgi:hypothetical protein